MDPLQAALQIHAADEPADALRALVTALAGEPISCAMALDPGDRTVLHRWPDGVELSDDLIDMAFHVARPEVFPIGSEFPSDAEAHPDSGLLLLPLRSGTQRLGVYLLVGSPALLGEDVQLWQPVLDALEQVHRRHARLRAAEAEREELRERVEETEALHTLGLAANRTLDMEEVLNLVARFTRTLLGAQYVTVTTVDGERIETLAAVGLRTASVTDDDYHLARAVIEAEKPLTVGGGESNLPVENFPFHAQEGMIVGLGIPLILFGETFGALVVGYRREYAVAPRDIRLALTLAGHAAVAISNARLHAEVAERSEELGAAYDELSKLSLAKERFFASINHELRNPVGAIMGYNTLILDGIAGEIPEAATRYLTKAQRAAENLLALVNDILDLSKLAAGKMDVSLEEITVPTLFENVTGIIGPLADQKGVSLRVDAGESLPTLKTDPLRVQQILVNLLSNAVKFTRGDVHLGARLLEGGGGAAGDGPGAQVEIEVADTGAGIPPEDLGRIFEEYEQVKGTKGGTGLGLPISRRLAVALGGELLAESEVGVGSRFLLRLPVAAA